MFENQAALCVRESKKKKGKISPRITSWRPEVAQDAEIFCGGA
jgi:hypothetical protein